MQIEREKLRTEELASKTVLEKSEMDRSLGRLEEDNMDMQKAIQNLQVREIFFSL